VARKAFVWMASAPSDGALTLYWTLFNEDGSIYGVAGENYPWSLAYSDNECSIRDQIVDYLQTSVDPDGTCKVIYLP